MSSPLVPTWRPAPALIVSMAIAAFTLILAAAFARPDLLAFGLPFVLIVAWMLATKPSAHPSLHCAVSSRTPTEGTVHQWQLKVDDVTGADAAYVMIVADRNVRWEGGPTNFSTTVSGDGLQVRRSWEVMRWGQADIGMGSVILSSPWAGFRLGPLPLQSTRVRALPAPTAFELEATVPHPIGLVGRNRSSRQGDGAEFADVRQFRIGDTLRHVHWPVSARTGELHVRANYAEQDTQITVLVDASLDVGPTGGVHGASSSLDVSLRAAASICAQFLGLGERVALQVVGVPEQLMVPPGVGQRHLRRIVDTLSMVNPVGAPMSRRLVRLPQASGMFLLISPLLSEVPMQIAALASSRGLTVVVIDVLDVEAFVGGTEDGTHDRIAARLRVLERTQEIAAIQSRGVPVTTWRGPGSLDVVLRQLARRPAPVIGRR